MLYEYLYCLDVCIDSLLNLEHQKLLLYEKTRLYLRHKYVLKTQPHIINHYL